MIFFGVLIGLILLTGMIYLAVSKKSAKGMRIAAVIALAVMITTVIICLFLIFFGVKAPVDESVILLTDAPLPPPKSSGNIWILLLFMLFLIGLFVIVLIISIREHKAQKKLAAKKETAALFLDE
jgi:cytochrome bd-type quinol oxidase subunit 2